MSRRGRINIISFTVALILTLSGFVYTNYLETQHYKWLLEAEYRQYFGTLMESIDKLHTTLQKGQYSSSPVMMASLSTEVSRQSAVASAALSGLPFSNVELENTAKFLSQVGDYSQVLSRKDVLGQSVTEDEKKNMQGLSDTALRLSSSLNELYKQVFESNLSVSDAVKEDNQSGVSMSNSIKEIETEFPQNAGLIYDGPFSDHINKMEALLLKGKEDVSKDTALEKAAETFKLEKKDLKLVGESNTDGNIDLYSFSKDEKDHSVYIDVTKKGGLIMNMMNSRAVTEMNLGAKDCIKKATDFMKTLGLENMVENYYISRNNVLTVNFAFTKDDVTYYPDLIKVSIAHDDGEVVGFESRGYIMSHTDRTVPTIQITSEQAILKVKDGLTLENSRLAVIPSAGKQERFCHELKFVDQYGQKCLIYVNVETGIEEQILILIEDDNGILTM